MNARNFLRGCAESVAVSAGQTLGDVVYDNILAGMSVAVREHIGREPSPEEGAIIESGLLFAIWANISHTLTGAYGWSPQDLHTQLDGNTDWFSIWCRDLVNSRWGDGGWTSYTVSEDQRWIRVTLAGSGATRRISSQLAGYEQWRPRVAGSLSNDIVD
jgi:hypothetical protein